MKTHRPVPHGTRTAYVNYGCKCVPCREADAAYQRERHRWRLERRPQRPGRPPGRVKVWAEPRLSHNERVRRQDCPTGCGGLLAEETIGRALRLLCTRCSWREWELVRQQSRSTPE